MTGVVRDRSTGTIVLREKRVVYASAGAAAVTGRAARDLLGRPFLDFIAPEDRERVGDRHERRLRGEPVPTEYEMVLLLPDGGRRTVEALVSLEGADEVVVQLRDLSDQTERRRRLAGLAELGVAIQRERTEAAIFERVREGLLGLGLASFLVRPEGGGLRVAWLRAPAPAEAAVSSRMVQLTQGYLGPWTSFSRTAWDEGVAFSDDWVLQAAAFLPPEYRRDARALAAELGLVRALAVRLDERRGATSYLVAAGDWPRPADVPAVRLFGAQVAAALDSARDIAELSERNFDLAALNRLGELAAGADGLDALLPPAGEVVRATSGCQAMAVYGADHATRTLRLLHAAGAPPEAGVYAAQTTFDSALGGVVTSRRLVVAQVADLVPAQRAWLEKAGFRTFAWVPLVSRSRVLGVMVTAWQAARDAPACRPELLLAMGAHFAAAMEAHDLLGDLRRRVAELTLLNDVAVATATLDPVLLLENALRRVCETFGGDGAFAYLVEGEALVQKASIGIDPEAAALVARLDLGEGPAGLAVERQQVVTEPTPEELGPRCAAVRAREGFQAVVAVPLLAKTRAAGALCLARRAARPFARGDVALLSAIGAQLGVAVDAARQYADTQRRARDLEAINALALRVFGSAPGEARALLDDACREVAGALGARQALVLLLDEDGRTLRLAAAHGEPVPPDLRTLPLERAPLAAEALRTGVPAFAEAGGGDP
ncbi:MAG TPA: GAF domain-containing protein, partial [Anaeromyxobacteraceae bacterium]|nr:GAF domain-containing protein [Anaeromyxobacteraceae bacterium]